MILSLYFIGLDFRCIPDSIVNNYLPSYSINIQMFKGKGQCQNFNRYNSIFANSIIITNILSIIQFSSYQVIHQMDKVKASE